MPRAPEDALPAEQVQNRRVLGGILGFFGVLTAVVVAAGFVIYRMVVNSPVANVRERMGQQADLLTEAQVGPGAKLMRAEGCHEAMVFEVETMLARADELAGEPVPRSPDQPRYIAACRMNGTAEGAPDCGRLAYEMATQLPLDGKLAVVVTVLDAGGDTGPRCARLFRDDGGFIGPYNRNLVPLPLQL